VSNVISMDDHASKLNARAAALRDRRYAIRFPFAADAELIDLETGSRADGVTSDLSLGGCFVCSSKPLKANSRVRITLTRKGQSVQALGVIRIVKPRIGMGVEFIDVDERHNLALTRWLDQLRREY
jgi:c-di-GMP-binding flagellar brake protein YcgR